MRGAYGWQNSFQPADIVHQIFVQESSITITDPVQGALQGAGFVQLFVGMLMAQPNRRRV